MKLEELKDFFSSIELPKEIVLNSHSFIKNVQLMVDSHLSVLERNKGNKTFLPYYERLMILYRLLL